VRALVGIVAVAAVATGGLVGTSASAGAQPFTFTG
jgi:hypothetical protein